MCFEEHFSSVFSKFVHAESFRVPLSVKELREFTVEVCKELFKLVDKEGELSAEKWSEDGSTRVNDGAKVKKSKEENKDTPIGLNSLSKTFNIIKIVGQGEQFISNLSEK